MSSAFRRVVRALREADETHEWFERYGLTCCKVCGIVRRADGQNKPCKGPVSVGPRATLEKGNG